MLLPVTSRPICWAESARAAMVRLVYRPDISDSRVHAATGVFIGAGVRRVPGGAGGRAVRGQGETNVVAEGRTESAAAQQRALRSFELAAHGVAPGGVEPLQRRQVRQGELECAFAGEQPLDLGVRQRFGRALEGEPQADRG